MDDNMKTAVLLCGDWGQSTQLARLPIDEAVEMHAVPGLCARPEEIGRLLAGGKASRLVLGLCPGEYSLAEVQAQVRKAGLDPLGAEIAQLGGMGLEKARLLLAAAVGKARAYAGSRPENAKMRLSSRMSRRSLFRLSVSEYVPAPSIEYARCTADLGCRACAQACPLGALEWSEGRITYDKQKCEPCGLCTSACPRDAVVYPAFTPAQMEAQIGALLSVGYPGDRGILFTCSRNQQPKGAEGWMPVQLPCTGMASPTWFLASLLMGAGAVCVMPCVKGCPLGQAGAIGRKVAFCRQLLRSVGAPEGLVAVNPIPGKVPPGGERKASVEDPFSRRATATVLLRLARAYGTDQIALEHPGSPVGTVEIREDLCTGCGTCAVNCPTGALIHEKGDENITLTFDASTCVACGLCLPKCPEVEHGAITLSKGFNLAHLSQGRKAIHREETARCVTCGGPVAGVKMVKRLKELMGGENAAIADLLARYCPGCRNVGALHGHQRST